MPRESKSDDLGASEVQSKMDEEQEKGYRGSNTDPTPDHAYTLAGVVAKEPTPETDPNLQRDARTANGRR